MEQEHVHVLSLGAGTQSSAMALMAAHGDLPRPDYIIFSDTGWEPQHVYKWLEDLKAELAKFDLEVITVSEGNIHDDVLRAQETGERVASLPYYTWDEKKQEKGITMRQCTGDYKIKPINKKIREILGYKKGQRVKEMVHMWKGITTDEIARIKPSQERWIAFDYPLFDRNMDRLDAINYVRNKMGRIPPKSSCIGCPFHNNEMWLDIKRNHPEDWQNAVEFDKKIRNNPKYRSKLYLHKSCKPLDEVDLQEDQTTLADFLDDFDSECSGMCGM